MYNDLYNNFCPHPTPIGCVIYIQSGESEINLKILSESVEKVMYYERKYLMKKQLGNCRGRQYLMFLDISFKKLSLWDIGIMFSMRRLQR